MSKSELAKHLQRQHRKGTITTQEVINAAMASDIEIKGLELDIRNDDQDEIPIEKYNEPEAIQASGDVILFLYF
jgi:hypothetical protein